MCWKSIFLDHFLPSSIPMAETRLIVPKPQDVKSSDRFFRTYGNDIQQLIPWSGYTKIPYDIYCPSVQKDLKKGIWKDFQAYFPSLAAIKQHRKGSGLRTFFEIDDNTESAYESETVDETLDKALILNTFKILAVTPFLENCLDDDDKMN